MKFCNLRFVVLCSAAALLLVALVCVDANPVVTGGAVGPHGGGAVGGFAVGRSIAIGPGGQVKTGGFGPFIGGLPFFFRRR